MQPIPAHIVDFLNNHYVVNFATHTADDFWAANCFYIFDEQHARLIVLTSKKTRHAKLMLENPYVVGTIYTQTNGFTEVEGIQFSAYCTCLTEDAAHQARSIYYQRYPIARLKPTDVWELRFEQLKHTGNKLIFAKKTLWTRTEHEPQAA